MRLPVKSIPIFDLKCFQEWLSCTLFFKTRATVFNSNFVVPVLGSVNLSTSQFAYFIRFRQVLTSDTQHEGCLSWTLPLLEDRISQLFLKNTLVSYGNRKC